MTYEELLAPWIESARKKRNAPRNYAAKRLRLQLLSRVDSPKSADGFMPHRFPKLDEGDSVENIIAWICQACGEAVSEFGNEPKTDCTVDWRGGSR